MKGPQNTSGACSSNRSSECRSKILFGAQFLQSELNILSVQCSKRSLYEYHCMLYVAWVSVYNTKQDPVCGVTPAVTRTVQIGQRRVAYPMQTR